MKPSLPARLGMWAIAAVAGAVYGVVGTVAHASTLGILPVGLVLSLIGAGSLVLAVRLLTDRRAAIATTAGMTLAIVVFSGEGPGGSVIAPAGLPATIWTILCPLVAVMVVAFPQLPSAAPRSTPSS
ncbi:DUF6113 family protein [Microbacterium limosum]|uniref:DUF6113 family protein n=1 Tax=Microbacterium limosum TaxID=3079935 RepID=A0AAU0MKL6_9MICO|nr:DUF6113 family protein [Microbacterium sp. Y20]WOQ70292.1 DUF6113 family protein [Microbacterium sp. Y20]